MSKLASRLAAWAQRNMPTHEQMAASRWVPERALSGELWRFTRRSVPRGVALGLLVGILLPFAQILFAAMLSLTVRANVPVAALTTFVTNPFTTPFIWALSYKVGGLVLHVDNAAGGAINSLLNATDLWSFLEWLTAEGKVLAFGLVVVAVVSAALGYLLSSWAWRIRVARKRRAGRGGAAA